MALRKRNLSVYDIQHELAAGDRPISINALTVLLREEGFARLPRRRDEERPATIKAESAEVADVRRLDLSPRSFRTTVAGLFLFVPLLEGMDVGRVVQAGRLPGSKMIPAERAVRSLLALKLLGTERKSHVMELTRISHQPAGQLVSAGVPTRHAGERAPRWVPDRPSEPEVA